MRRIYTQMQRGIRDDNQLLRVVNAQTSGRPPHAVVTIAEGRKHEVKRLFSHFGLQVLRLRRISLGPITLGNVKPGAIVRLNKAEMDMLDKFINGLSPSAGGKRGNRPL